MHFLGGSTTIFRYRRFSILISWQDFPYDPLSGTVGHGESDKTDSENLRSSGGQLWSLKVYEKSRKTKVSKRPPFSPNIHRRRILTPDSDVRSAGLSIKTGGSARGHPHRELSIVEFLKYGNRRGVKMFFREFRRQCCRRRPAGA